MPYHTAIEAIKERERTTETERLKKPPNAHLLYIVVKGSGTVAGHHVAQGLPLGRHCVHLSLQQVLTEVLIARWLDHWPCQCNILHPWPGHLGTWLIKARLRVAFAMSKAHLGNQNNKLSQVWWTIIMHNRKTKMSMSQGAFQIMHIKVPLNTCYYYS